MGREKREFKEWVLTRLRGQEVTVTDWEVIVGFNDESSIGGFSQRGLVGERVGKSHRRSLRRGRGWFEDVKGRCGQRRVRGRGGGQRSG